MQGPQGSRYTAEIAGAILILIKLCHLHNLHNA